VNHNGLRIHEVGFNYLFTSFLKEFAVSDRLELCIPMSIVKAGLQAFQPQTFKLEFFK
jgi:hypothetical protein